MVYVKVHSSNPEIYDRHLFIYNILPSILFGLKILSDNLSKQQNFFIYCDIASIVF